MHARASAARPAAETLAGALSRCGGGRAVSTSVDGELIAAFRPREVMGLETAEWQLAIFDRLPERNQRRMLVEILDDQEIRDALAERTTRAWLAGDLDAIIELSREGILTDPALERALNTDRNRAWTDAIVPLLEGGKRPFVAVGTFHMLGDRGLPALLAARGYRVRRVQ